MTGVRLGAGHRMIEGILLQLLGRSRDAGPGRKGAAAIRQMVMVDEIANAVLAQTLLLQGEFFHLLR